VLNNFFVRKIQTKAEAKKA